MSTLLSCENPPDNPQRKALRITVTGTVQGVGFRPFVYRIACANNISGEVANSAAGVNILAAGQTDDLNNFLHQLREQHPPLAIIETLHSEAAESPGSTGFRIVASASTEEIAVVLPPDISICDDCRRELDDPRDRRYRYPLINCTNCGPRYTIIRNLPYDREQTAMAPYPLCSDCLQEYRDPGNRRFHAEATSCHQCGPPLHLLKRDGTSITNGDPLAQLANWIRAGRVVAVQGLGGFHIICDALNESAVTRLRQRKNRPAKPFAVLVANPAMAEEYGLFDSTSRALLTSPQRPIVIVPDRGRCSPAVTGELQGIGLFLPYTPIHLLLFNHLDCPLVATSANVSDEPIITSGTNLRARLGQVIDGSLEFERAIVNGCDDSVTAVVAGRPQLLRRARGYAPAAIKLPLALPQPVLAVGGDMKNTIGIGRQQNAILSPHVGDLHSLGAQGYFEETVAALTRLYKFEPALIVCDAHPDYFTSRWANQQGISLLRVQHHHAHALAAMADCGISPDKEMLAICWDGTGYGTDGTLWGGEFLLCTYREFQRLAHFRPLPLLGGEKAILEPRRVALGLLCQHYDAAALQHPSPAVRSFSAGQAAALYQMQQKGLNAPLSSSVGRLFDAVAALLDICQFLSYEGESGLRMEAYYRPEDRSHYSFTLAEGIIDCAPAIVELAEETYPERGVTRFINMLVEIIIEVMRTQGHQEAVVCGGVFQNPCLLTRLLERTSEEKLQIHVPRRVPVNDGCLALGQLAAAASAVGHHQ